MKGSSDGTHKLVLVGGGVLIIAANILLSWRNSSRQSDPRETEVAQIMEQYQKEMFGFRENPELGWFERQFCKGYKRSKFCEHRALSPFAKEAGLEIQSAPPKRGVVSYSLKLSKSDTFNKITVE